MRCGIRSVERIIVNVLAGIETELASRAVQRVLRRFLHV